MTEIVFRDDNTLRERKATESEELVAGGMEPPTVLLVDDEFDIRLLWRLGFNMHGGFGAISEASDGLDAVEMLQVERFDVVVTDFSMPGVSGFEVVEIARSRWPSSVVVMVSGTADVGDEALRRGASAFFDKHESTTERMPRFVSAVLGNHEVLAHEANARWTNRSYQMIRP